MNLRLVRLAGLAATVAAVACGALLGIDDRSLAPDGSLDGAAPSEAASPGTADGATIDTDSGTGPPVCDPAQCAAFDGGCASGRCVRTCAGGPAGCKGDIACPPGNDCTLQCQKAECNGVRCTGGRSCTIDCSDGDCHDVSCSSPRCTLLCLGLDSCADRKKAPAGRIACDGGISCQLECASNGCDAGYCCTSPTCTATPGVVDTCN